MDNRITEYPLADFGKKSVSGYRERWVVSTWSDIQRSKGKLRKGKCLDTGPINEDETASMCPNLPNTSTRGIE